MLGRIFGYTKDGEGTCRVKTKDGLNNLINTKNIINYIKIQNIEMVWPCRPNDKLKGAQKYVCVCVRKPTSTGLA